MELDPDLCDCACHTTEGMVHFMACCWGQCHCGKFIRHGAVENHRLKCGEPPVLSRKEQRKQRQGPPNSQR